jgi:(p)ppGpp synthase/HD superfamily hydrolase
MAFTSRIIKAINFAGRCHCGATRKGKQDVEYVTHPLGVALILTGIDCDEETVIAGILHDTVEDSQGKTTLQDIAKEFGDRVSRIVGDVTEKDKSLPWEERKKRALEHIPHMDKDSMLVKSADFLYNLKDLAADLEAEGDKAYDKFNAPKEKQRARFSNVVRALAEAWPDNPLLAELRETLKKIK